jgi:acetyl esterase/lipase
MAASLATRCADGSPTYAPGGAPPPDPALKDISCRPDFAVAVYPVITLTAPYVHERSRNNLLGDAEGEAAAALIDLLSIERHAPPNTAPMVIVHSRGDHKVPYQNSELLHAALTAQGVDNALLLFDDGKHGVGLAQRERTPNMATWPGFVLDWLRERGFYSRAHG